jgi:hypothetical protein
MAGADPPARLNTPPLAHMAAWASSLEQQVTSLTCLSSSGSQTASRPIAPPPPPPLPAPAPGPCGAARSSSMMVKGSPIVRELEPAAKGSSAAAAAAAIALAATVTTGACTAGGATIDGGTYLTLGPPPLSGSRPLNAPLLLAGGGGCSGGGSVAGSVGAVLAPPRSW